ncbi:MAG: KH domain-containing protein [Coriobacteriaceae bacterium]|jgi:predicted RNA-binding protein YlqC (UPF0109 family)|nr:KH domain-containing protein [Coriobacteriaceae bacterium]
MSEQTVEIADLVSLIIDPLLEFKDQREVILHDEDEENILIEIRVHEEDVGKVIGRQGRVIKAIRTLSRAAGSSRGIQVDVELID